ncbi:Asp domain-containing protein [Cephalotus follicularis]|uniref:Asp domain-containing protein n=1 Tax=Cephalotus follicularis TaxID=3775 RepID=A0A1Q3BVN6_CEPFO|nr:Asp domain-containing protein [Cephalotus follicularis]
MFSSDGEYFMAMSIGTPPVKVLAIADTGSDLIWIQCKPCKRCYRQNPALFDPKKSSSYENLPCGSDSCKAIQSPGRSCRQDQNACKYSYSYADQSFSRGNLALEKFTFGSTRGPPVSLPMMVFGCGHDNGGDFDKFGSGIVGLGGGPLSLVPQLGASINWKFSYCLIPYVNVESSDVTNKITFGANAMVSDANVSTTPLVDKQPSTYYYLTLEAISVGNKRLAHKGLGSDTEEGNIIIDSGTTLTFIGSHFYEKLVSALEKVIGAKLVSDPRGFLSACFKYHRKIDLPIITFHFTGADVELQSYNTFARLEDDFLCLTMIPSKDLGVFGNLAQANFLIGYDLEKRTVSFKQTDCTKQ